MFKSNLLPAILCFLVLGISYGENSNPYYDPSKTHHTREGFTNPYLDDQKENKSFGDLINMIKEDRPDEDEIKKKNITVFTVDDLANAPQRFAVWGGHSTMLVVLEGKLILTDPILSEYCSPVQFAGPKRYTPPAIDKDVLTMVDLVLISHNHYDHLDYNTVMLIGNHAKWIVPLGLKQWFKEQGIYEVKEYDWWDDDLVEGVKITCLPSQHWSKRTVIKEFDTLWASWAVEHEGFKFWFAGDTGYNSNQFREIGEKAGPFDFSAIPIGGYDPRWFMSNFHVDPGEAVAIHLDVRSKRSVGVHWGTFVLTTEPVNEPPQKLKQVMVEKGMNPLEFIAPVHGEIIVLD